MRRMGLILIGCLVCGCENQKLTNLHDQNILVQSEIKQCETAMKALDHERGRLDEVLETEKALQAEIKSLKTKKH